VEKPPDLGVEQELRAVRTQDQLQR